MMIFIHESSSSSSPPRETKKVGGIDREGWVHRAIGIRLATAIIMNSVILSKEWLLYDYVVLVDTDVLYCFILYAA